MDRNITVLFVDDEQHILNALKRVVRGENYRVLTANDPHEALDIVRNEDVDIVVSDHLMPGMDGIEFLSKVRQIKPATMRIILTGHAQLNMAIEAINQGQVYKFMTKPWDDAVLLQELRLAARVVMLERQNLKLKAEVERQAHLLEDMEKQFPGITTVRKDEKGRIVIDDVDED